MSSNKSQKPIFVELVLENIWSVYDTLIKSKDKCKIDKMADALNIKISSYDLKSKDRRKVLRTFMGQWMPIAPAILRRLTECVGSPKAFGEERLLTSFTVCKDTPEHIIVDMETCSKYSDTVFVFCPKIFIVEKSMINVGLTSGENSEHIERRRFADIARNNQLIYEKSENLFNRNYDSDQSNNLSDSDCTSESSYLIVGLVRIYSGTIKCGQTLHVYGPNYNIDVPDKHTYSFEVESLYILMGRELVETRSVTAGNIFGVRLPDTHSFKTCMISSHSPGYIKSNYTRYVPIVRVAVEPKNPTQIQRLVNGLKRLNQSDSSVEVYFSDTGEHIIAAAGELHLEKCLDDLREVFAKISIQSSSPIVPFRETVANICGSSNFSNKSFQLYFQRYFKNRK